MTTIRTASFGMALLLSHLAGPALAQSSAVLDEATLSVSRKGTPIGRESFRIIRAPAPGGQVFLATGTSVLGDSKLTTRLGTDSSGVPVSYESEHALKGRLFQRLKGQGRPGRFSVLKQTKSGESAREYVLNNGALLMDEDVFHHLYFVAIAAAHESLVVIAPRSGEQGQCRVEDRGLENVDIAGRSITGRRFALIDPPSAVREVWVDEKGRLLKVSVPAKGLIALRDDPPR